MSFANNGKGVRPSACIASCKLFGYLGSYVCGNGSFHHVSPCTGVNGKAERVVVKESMKVR